MVHKSAMAGSGPSTRYSIIVPVKNEQDNILPQIAEICAAMEAQSESFEILYVDDGSSDSTFDILSRARHSCPQLRVLRMDRNHGQSAATEAGIRHARGEVLVTLDGDMQNDPADIPALLARIGEADMVCGYRIRRNDNLWRRLQSRVGNTVRNKLTAESIRDTGCSLKAFRRECLVDVRLFHGMHRFLPTLARMQGFRVVEHGVSHRPRTKGVTKYGISNRAFKSLHDLFAVRWMINRYRRYLVEEHMQEIVEEVEIEPRETRG